MGEVSYRPLIEDMTWSYSRIQCFHACKYRWFLQYIRQAPETPQFYSSYGLFMHKLLEGYYKGELSREEMQRKFLFDFASSVQGERPTGDTVGKYVRAGVQYLKSFDPIPYRPVAVEKKLRFSIRGSPFVGFLDYLGERRGALALVDHKSRELKPRSGRKTPTKKDEELSEMLRQLYVYAAAVEQETGELPQVLCFNCFKNGVFIEEPFQETAYQEAMDWVEQSIEEIKNEEDFPPSIEYFGCRYLCSVRGECCYWGGDT